MTTPDDLKAIANRFLDGDSSYGEFMDDLIEAVDSMGVPGHDEAIIWLAKAIAERDLPANHRLIGAGK